MRNYINIGCSLSGEDCAQVGSNDYEVKSQRECRAFLAQIRRELGDEVGTAHLSVKSFPHDFGSYREVICYYDEDDEEGRNYAFRCESESPEYWDNIAKQALNGDYK